MQELRVCVFDSGAGDRVGTVVHDQVYDLNLCCVQQLAAEKKSLDSYRLANTLVPPELGVFIEGGANVLSSARQALAWVLKSGVAEGPGGEAIYRSAKGIILKAPILPSSKVICLGDTYISHFQVSGSSVPENMGLFYKMTQVVVGPDEFVVIPKHHSGPVVYGTELTVVIGKQGRSIPEGQVEDHIWGYTIFNDVTLRKLAPNLGPTDKVFETSAPVGPWIVPKDQIAKPQDLKLSFRINGKQMQDGSTSSMRFSIPSMVAEVSKWHVLSPGDIIATGDLGATESIKPGDIMEAEIEGIGVLQNPVKLEE